jgi:uncharacterized protein (UPF0335 family)
VDRQLKKLMNELGEAINESLTESEQIAEVIARIKDSGYDVYLVLEATVGFTKQEEERSPSRPARRVSGRAKMPEFKLNSHDKQFLKALRISLDEAA